MLIQEFSFRISSSNYLAGTLYGNAGFHHLKDTPELELYEPRYNPTVVPIAKDSSPSHEHTNASPDPPQNSPTRHTSAYTYHELYKAGTVTPTAVATTILNLISENRSHGNAFLDIKKDLILSAAAESTARYKAGRPLGPLDGVPVTVKDEVDLAEHKKTIGSTKDFTDPRNVTSWCAAQWAEAGAVVVGKSNMHEIGLDTTNNNPLTKTPLNPHNKTYYTGGSSGGSAYAVAAGLVPIAHGVDGGGSIRIPSSYCGLYGLKPSHRRVSRHPSLSLAASNSCDGPMTACMADLEMAYRIMAAPNPNDSLNSLFPGPPSSSPSSSTDEKVLGIYDAWFDAADPVVRETCRKAVEYYTTRRGYRVEKIEIPHLGRGQAAHAITILNEVATGLRLEPWSGFSGAIKTLLSVGRYVSGVDLLAAQKMRALLMSHLAYLWTQHPGMLIVVPTSPLPGWHIAGGDADLRGGISDSNTSYKNMIYVWLANFTGVPAISVPVGMVDGHAHKGGGKVPIGLMAMAEWGGEEALIQWGKEGEEWAWAEAGVTKPQGEGWVDVVEMAKKM